MRTRLVSIALFVAMPGICECVQVGPAKFAKVEVLAMDFLGHRLPNPEIDLVEAGSRASFKSSFHGPIAEKIPYGYYTIRVRVPGFRSGEQKIYVDQASVVARVQLNIDAECHQDAGISGLIKPAPGDRELWIKLIPIIGTADTVEVPVQSSGSFKSPGLPFGDYILMILDGANVLYTAPVRTALVEHSLSVDLKGRSVR